MKRFAVLFFAVIFGSGALFAGGKKEAGAGGKADKDTSYAFGVVFGEQFREFGIPLDYAQFLEGFRLAAEGKPTRISADDALALGNAAVEAAVTEKTRAEGEKNLAEAEKFLAENALRPEVRVLDSGLQYEARVEGTGKQPAPDSTVMLIYEGRYAGGEVFDSSGGEAVEFPLDGVIPGFQEGLTLMREGGKATLYIPPALGYGPEGASGFIPPNAALVFDVELVEVLSD